MRATLPLLSLFLVGCASQVAGIWMVTLDTELETEREVECTENINYVGCRQLDPDLPGDGWEITEEQNEGTESIFAQIFGSADGEMLMVVADEIYVGEKDDDGAWDFSNEMVEGSSSSRAHAASNYAFSADEDYRWRTTLHIEFDGDEATGQLTQVSSLHREYHESDTWNYETSGLFYGRIGDAAYSLLDEYVYNPADTTECKGADCEVIYTGTVTGEASFVAHRTDIEPDAFDGIRYASDGGGPR